VMRLHGAVTIYRHPNSLGGLAMGAVPFVAFLLPVWRAWYERVALLALLGTSLVCVLYTGSRTAYVAFLAFLLYWWLVSRRKLTWLLAAVAIGAVAIAVIPQEYKERFLSIGGGREVEGHSRELRLEILRDAFTIFLENPGGVGVASFPAVRLQRFGRVQDTHNLYLEVATNLGVQGLLAFCFLVVAMLSAYRRAQRLFVAQRQRLAPLLAARGLPPALRRAAERHVDDLRFLTALCLAAGGFIYVRLALGLFGMDLYEVYWWFGAGLAIALLNLTIATERNTARLLAAAEQSAPAPAAAPA